MPHTIRLGHSPDPDDAFMWFPLLGEGLVDTGDYRFEHVIQDIETLNRRAATGDLEVTALSIHAYAYVADRYALLNAGASMGEGYGPLVVSREALAAEDLAGRRIAIPGELTSGTLALRMHTPSFLPDIQYFEAIPAIVASGEVDAGLLIHEGQITYHTLSLYRVVDLGAWWAKRTDGLPMPLGGNAIRRDLGEPAITELAAILESSIRYALAHRSDALAHAMRYGRDLDEELTDRFVAMYVNDRTLDFGDDGRRAVCQFLDEAYERGLIPRKVEPEFIGAPR